MSTRLGNCIIVFGVIGIFGGLVCIPGAMSGTGDTSILTIGASLFSMGALAVGAGLYLKARAMTAVATDQSSAVRQIRGGCNICHADVPVIDCKVHNLHLCAECLSDHYDFRSCAYVPSTRRTAAKPKAAAKAFGM